MIDDSKLQIAAILIEKGKAAQKEVLLLREQRDSILSLVSILKQQIATDSVYIESQSRELNLQEEQVKNLDAQIADKNKEVAFYRKRLKGSRRETAFVGIVAVLAFIFLKK